MANEVSIDLTVRGKEEAVKAIKSLQDMVKKLQGGVGKTRKDFNGFFSFISKGALSVVKTLGSLISTIGKTVIAFTALGAAIVGLGIKKAVAEAARLENALIGLSSVARNTGQNVSGITEAAKELAADGVIPLSDVSASLKNLLASGLDADKAVETFKALRDAAAFNRQGQLSMAEAVRGATDGIKNQNSILVDNAGITKNISILVKEYAREIGLSVNELTEQQKQIAIANGVIKEAAVFQGDYNKSLTTYTGVVTKAGGNLRFLLAALGETVTKNETVIAVIGEVSKGFEKLRDFVKENQKEFRDLASKGIKLLIQGFAFLFDAITEVSKKLASLKSPLQEVFNITAQQNINKYREELKKVNEEIKKLSQTSNVGGGEANILRGLDEATKQAEILRNKIAQMEGAMKENNGETNEFVTILEKVNTLIQNINEDIQKTTGEVKALQDNLPAQINVELTTSEKIQEAISFIGFEFSKLFSNDQIGFGEGLVNALGAAKAGITFILSELWNNAVKNISATDVANIGGYISEGAKGAQKLLTDGISGGLDLIAPGLGKAAKPILDAFSQGPDSVKNLVQEFAQSLPEIGKNIILSAPAFIEAIIEELPKLIESILEAIPQVVTTLATESVGKLVTKLIEKVPSIINAIIFETPKIIRSIIGQLPTLIKTLGEGLFQALGDAGSFLIEQLKDFPRLLGNAAIQAGNYLIRAIKNAFDSIVGGVGDFASGVGDFLGFAKGGEIPKGFNNDNFPMRATSGEYVLDRSLTSQLKDFLSQQNNETDLSLTNSLLSSILSSMQNQQNISTSVEFNQDTFAEILVNLNRTGARTA